MANNLYNTMYNPDVLSCIANLSNDEVFTPPEVANAMLDLLPQELFSDPDTTFLDPACKSGVFLREIAKRLLKGLEPLYPDLQERTDHIFKHQLYGIAITELTSHLSRRSLYCSKFANGRYSVATFENVDGNVRFKNIKHRWQNGKCVFCGASQKEYDRADDLETHAYEMIHTTKPEGIFNMKFDVIIGNPPYQLSDGGNKNSAKPIYQYFVQQAMKLRPRYLSMIIPARWYAGGKGLDEFRSTMLQNRHITRLIDYSNAKDCFPGISLGGGVCYFLWDRDHEDDCEYTNIHDGMESTQKRNLQEFPVFVRYNEAISIINKVQKKAKNYVSDVMGGRNPYGFESFARGEKRRASPSDCTLYYSGGIGYVPLNSVTKARDLVDKYNIMISRATAEHAGEPDNSGMYNVLSVIKVLKPHEVCTDSYLLAYSTDKEDEATIFADYVRTKFFRFLVLQSVTSISLSKEKFGFVPMVDLSKKWTDADLYKEFGLSEEEVNFIESMIKEKAAGGDE